MKSVFLQVDPLTGFCPQAYNFFNQPQLLIQKLLEPSLNKFSLLIALPKRITWKQSVDS